MRLSKASLAGVGTNSGGLNWLGIKKQGVDIPSEKLTTTGGFAAHGQINNVWIIHPAVVLSLLLGSACPPRMVNQITTDVIEDLRTPG
ncbi:MAG TPA: hypothetical protein VJM12_02145 [Pyrinomonadaceae bacterium]|nr:hypothetical protein [Pyrinomonadaceae bacterium]